MAACHHSDDQRHSREDDGTSPQRHAALQTTALQTTMGMIASVVNGPIDHGGEAQVAHGRSRRPGCSGGDGLQVVNIVKGRIALAARLLGGINVVGESVAGLSEPVHLIVQSLQP